MPRMSKSKKLEWSFFLNDRGRKAYNTLCRRCVHAQLLLIGPVQGFRRALAFAQTVLPRMSLFARIINPRGQKKGGTSAYSPRGPDGTPP